jgi:hypothetical protein
MQLGTRGRLASTLAIDESKALLALCRAGRLYEVEDWIKAGLSLEVAASLQTAPLQVAIETGFHSLIELLAKMIREGQRRATYSSTLLGTGEDLQEAEDSLARKGLLSEVGCWQDSRATTDTEIVSNTGVTKVVRASGYHQSSI